MALWQCNNKKLNGKACDHFEKTPGNIPPPTGRCKSCGKKTNWIKIKLPDLARRGGQMSLPSSMQLGKKRVQLLMPGLKKPNLNIQTPGDIIRFIRTVSSKEACGWKGMQQDEKRVTNRLFIACAMHDNAQYLYEKLQPRTYWQLIQELDAALKDKWDVAGGLIGGIADYKRYANKPQELRTYAKQAMKETNAIWPKLQTEEDKEKYLYYVFEHEKGYHRIVECIGKWEHLGERPKKLVGEPEWTKVKGGLGRVGGRKAFGALQACFAIQQKHMRDLMNGKFVGKVFYIKGEGSYKLIKFHMSNEQGKVVREYEYTYLEPKDLSPEKDKVLQRR